MTLSDVNQWLRQCINKASHHSEGKIHMSIVLAGSYKHSFIHRGDGGGWLTCVCVRCGEMGESCVLVGSRQTDRQRSNTMMEKWWWWEGGGVSTKTNR